MIKVELKLRLNGDEMRGVHTPQSPSKEPKVVGENDTSPVQSRQTSTPNWIKDAKVVQAEGDSVENERIITLQTELLQAREALALARTEANTMKVLLFLAALVSVVFVLVDRKN